VLVITHLFKQLRPLDGDGQLVADRAEEVEVVIAERAPCGQQQVEDAHRPVLPHQGHGRVLLCRGLVR
jgi:hypothetical protein